MRLLPSIVLCVMCIPTLTFAQSKTPPQSERDQATADITGTNTGLQTAAVTKIEAWVKGGWVSMDVWRKWLPALVKAGRHQDAYDLATLALCGRPNPDAAATLQEARMRAMLALAKNDDALKMAKAYYNLVDIKSTATAVDFVGTCLAKARPDDLEIVRRFRNEQAQASQGTPPADPDKAILKTITIDDAPFADALKAYSAKTKFADRVGYANLLLLSDHGNDAEKVFRELYQMAATANELTQATEGIARSLRAQDGNVARANAWLTKIAATAPPATATSQTQPAPATKPNDVTLP